MVYRFKDRFTVDERPYDNACAESFFSLLKNECIYRAKPRTIRDAMELIDDYIYFYI